MTSFDLGDSHAVIQSNRAIVDLVGGDLVNLTKSLANYTKSRLQADKRICIAEWDARLGTKEYSESYGRIVIIGQDGKVVFFSARAMTFSLPSSSFFHLESDPLVVPYESAMLFALPGLQQRAISASCFCSCDNCTPALEFLRFAGARSLHHSDTSSWQG